jgi:mannose/fructose-specific phosphotransferase system component IIA
MSEGAAVRGVVLAHGLLAEGLVDAARQITGAGDEVLIARSNRGLSPVAFVEEVRRLFGNGPGIIFTDLPSGSCYLTARRLHREGLQLLVISGVNLAVLLDFIMHRDLALTELGPRLLEKGRAAISITPSTP